MSRDRGSSTLLITGVIALIALVSVATAGLGLAYGARAQAQTAADAAALAAAVATYPPASMANNPTGEARAIARANGAALVRCDCRVDMRMRPRVVTVVTVVEADLPVFGLREVRATARAEFDPELWLGR